MFCQQSSSNIIPTSNASLNRTPSFAEGVMISIECRAYDQRIVHNSQEAIGLVHFEVKMFFRIIHHCHSAVFGLTIRYILWWSSSVVDDSVSADDRLVDWIVGDLLLPEFELRDDQKRIYIKSASSLQLWRVVIDHWSKLVLIAEELGTPSLVHMSTSISTNIPFLCRFPLFQMIYDYKLK